MGCQSKLWKYALIKFLRSSWSIAAVFARDSVYAIARICDRNSGRLDGRLDVCVSHGWIVQKRLKLGSCNFHHRVAP